MMIKRGQVTIFIIMAILLVASISIVFFVSKKPEQMPAPEGECSAASDCVKAQTTCCPCSMGGKEECMTKSMAAYYKDKLAKECKRDSVCLAVYNCQKDVLCKCIGGKCQK